MAVAVVAGALGAGLAVTLGASDGATAAFVAAGSATTVGATLELTGAACCAAALVLADTLGAPAAAEVAAAGDVGAEVAAAVEPELAVVPDELVLTDGAGADADELDPAELAGTVPVELGATVGEVAFAVGVGVGVGVGVAVAVGVAVGVGVGVGGDVALVAGLDVALEVALALPEAVLPVTVGLARVPGGELVVTLGWAVAVGVVTGVAVPLGGIASARFMNCGGAGTMPLGTLAAGGPTIPPVSGPPAYGLTAGTEAFGTLGVPIWLAPSDASAASPNTTTSSMAAAALAR